LGTACSRIPNAFFKIKSEKKKWARALYTKEALVFFIEFVIGERKKMAYIELMMKNN
jgi:hypothetical protein